jgi:PAS domain-containing protein
MQKRLHRRERLLRSIIENVSDSIYRLVPGEGLVYANRAFVRLFGKERERARRGERDPFESLFETLLREGNGTPC